jgi:hypothetical protein
MHTDGVFAQHSMGLHIPLHLSALDRSPSLLPWIQSWCPVSDILPLYPSGWFIQGHGLTGRYITVDGIGYPQLSDQTWYLWTPPPAACRQALEQLAISQHKRPTFNISSCALDCLLLSGESCSISWLTWLLKSPLAPAAGPHPCMSL